MKNIRKKKFLDFLDPEVFGESGKLDIEVALEMLPPKITYKSRETGKPETWLLGIDKTVDYEYRIMYDRYGWEGVEESIPYPEISEEDIQDLATYGMYFPSRHPCPTVSRNFMESLRKILEFLIESKNLPGKYLFGPELKRKILEGAKTRIQEDTLEIGIKYAISRELHSIIGIYYTGPEIVDIFPSLVPEYFGIELEGDWGNLFGSSGGFWWPLGDKESRIAAINKLIETI